MNPAYEVAPGTFAAHYRHKGSGVAGHTQANFEFRFAQGAIITDGMWEGCTFPYYIQKYNERMKEYNHFYQGCDDAWLFIEFWGVWDRIDEVGPKLVTLLEEICADIESTFGLKRVPIPSGFYYPWEEGYNG